MKPFPTMKDEKLRLGVDSYCLIPWGSDLALIGQEEAVCALGSVGPQMAGRGGADVLWSLRML